MSNTLTPAKNYQFIVSSYNQARKEFKELEKIRHKLNHKEFEEQNAKRLKGIGLEGSSRSSKTWDTSIFICQYIYKNKDKNKLIGICRDTLANLKDTTYQTLKQVWGLFGYDLSVFNKVASQINYFGCTIKFLGVNDNIMKAHGFETDILFINEALSVSQETRNQLEQRCKEFFIYDYNPSATVNSLYDYEKREDYKLLKTNIFDNPYAPANAKSKIISYADNQEPAYNIALKAGYNQEEWDKILERNHINGTNDLFMWQVYGLGMRAVGEDAIFKQYELYNEEPKQYEYILYGLDFGYKNDPTALVQVIKDGHNLYVKELIYSTGLLNNDVANKIHNLGLGSELIIADSSPAQNIDELRMLNVNATDCIKFQGSKMWGIQSIHQHKLFIHSESENLITEVQNFRYAKDKQNNFKRNTLGQRIAIDGNDDCIQAMIYAVTYYINPPESFDKS